MATKSINRHCLKC